MKSQITHSRYVLGFLVLSFLLIVIRFGSRLMGGANLFTLILGTMDEFGVMFVFIGLYIVANQHVNRWRLAFSTILLGVAILGTRIAVRLDVASLFGQVRGYMDEMATASLFVALVLLLNNREKQR